MNLLALIIIFRALFAEEPPGENKKCWKRYIVEKVGYSLILASLAIILSVILRLDGAYGEGQAQTNAHETEEEKLVRELMHLPPEVAEEQKHSVYLGGHGVIERMLLPEGWVEGRSDIGIFHYLGFHAPDRKDVNVSSYFVWRPLSDRDSESFLRVLKRLPHILDRDEIMSLRPVFESLMHSPLEEFEIRSAKSQDVNRRRVIAVDGEWIKHRMDSYMVFLDASGCGKLAQLIAYTAPTAEYNRYLPDALDAFKSLLWRSEINEFCLNK